MLFFIIYIVVNIWLYVFVGLFTVSNVYWCLTIVRSVYILNWIYNSKLFQSLFGIRLLKNVSFKYKKGFKMHAFSFSWDRTWDFSIINCWYDGSSGCGGVTMTSKTAWPETGGQSLAEMLFKYCTLTCKDDKLQVFSPISMTNIC